MKRACCQYTMTVWKERNVQLHEMDGIEDFEGRQETID